MTTTTFPTASVVSRALRRDVGIITVDTSKREGYSTHGGWGATSIRVSVGWVDTASPVRTRPGVRPAAASCGRPAPLTARWSSVASAAYPARSADWRRRMSLPHIRYLAVRCGAYGMARTSLASPLANWLK